VDGTTTCEPLVDTTQTTKLGQWGPRASSCFFGPDGHGNLRTGLRQPNSGMASVGLRTQYELHGGQGPEQRLLCDPAGAARLWLDSSQVGRTGNSFHRAPKKGRWPKTRKFKCYDRLVAVETLEPDRTRGPLRTRGKYKFPSTSSFDTVTPAVPGRHRLAKRRRDPLARHLIARSASPIRDDGTPIAARAGKYVVGRRVGSCRPGFEIVKERGQRNILYGGDLFTSRPSAQNSPASAMFFSFLPGPSGDHRVLNNANNTLNSTTNLRLFEPARGFFRRARIRLWPCAGKDGRQ